MCVLNLKVHELYFYVKLFKGVFCARYSMMQDRREQARQDLKGLEETVVSAIPHLKWFRVYFQILSFKTLWIIIVISG